ncbi:MAG TPA: sugar ABC transporter substrate-binding protein [Limnochordia bacterium]|nr:sugar ABC transporter substrate-binding protein [Limnochordia bacterium]
MTIAHLRRMSSAWKIVLALSVVAFGLHLALPAYADEVAIEMWVWGGAEETAELQQIIDRVNAANQGKFKVTVLNHPDGFYEKLQVALAAGTGPDIFYLDQHWTPAFATNGWLMPLDSYIDRDERVDLDDYYPFSLQSANFQGHQYGMPWIAQPVMVYYNRDMFQTVGLPEPNIQPTWAEFEEYAIRLTRDLDGDGEFDVWGYLQGDGWPPFEPWVWTNGGEVWTEGYTEMVLNQEASIEGLRFLYQLLHERRLSPTIDQIRAAESTSALFRAGRIGMFFGGAADGFYEEEFDVGMVVWPKNVQAATYMWSANLHINSATENPEVVWDAYVQILDGIHHWKIAPPRKSLAPILQDIEPRLTPQRVEAIGLSMPIARPGVVIVRNNEYWDVAGRMFWEPFLRGTMPVEQIVEQFTHAVNQLLK